MINGWGISCELALRWTSLDLTDKSTLVQVMAWCHQATSHHLSQWWPRSPYGVIRPQWVKNKIFTKYRNHWMQWRWFYEYNNIMTHLYNIAWFIYSYPAYVLYFKKSIPLSASRTWYHYIITTNLQLQTPVNKVSSRAMAGMTAGSKNTYGIRHMLQVSTKHPVQEIIHLFTGLILGSRPANESWR